MQKNDISVQELLSNVRRIELRARKTVDELMGGAYHSVFKGKGIEFEEVREYVPGDDVRGIDWNVTARMGCPYVKKFVEERELTVMLLVDVSASGGIGSRNHKSKQIAELGALLAFNAIRNNDRVGLMLFTDKEELYLPPRKGKRHVLRLIRELLIPRREGEKTNIKSALERFIQTHPRRTVMFLISDFIAEDYQRALTVANKKHDVIAIRVLDQCEFAIPFMGFLQVEDVETREVSLVSTFGKKFRQQFCWQAWKQHEVAISCCRAAGVDLIETNNGEDYIQPLMTFFRRRKKKSRFL